MRDLSLLRVFLCLSVFSLSLPVSVCLCVGASVCLCVSILIVSVRVSCLCEVGLEHAEWKNGQGAVHALKTIGAAQHKVVAWWLW